MSTNQAYPDINEIAPSWADVEMSFQIDGGGVLEMADISGLKWNRKVDVGEQRGTGGKVLARTSGQQSQGASMTLYRSGFRKLLRKLKDAASSAGFVDGNTVKIGLMAFDILVQHSVPNDPDIYTTKIKGCRYLGDSDDMKEGPDADKLEIELNPLRVVNVIDGVEVDLT